MYRDADSNLDPLRIEFHCHRTSGEGKNSWCTSALPLSACSAFVLPRKVCVLFVFPRPPHALPKERSNVFLWIVSLEHTHGTCAILRHKFALVVSQIGKNTPANVRNPGQYMSNSLDFQYGVKLFVLCIFCSDIIRRERR